MSKKAATPPPIHVDLNTPSEPVLATYQVDDLTFTAIAIHAPPTKPGPFPDYVFVQVHFPPPSTWLGTNPPASADLTIFAFDPTARPFTPNAKLPIEVSFDFEGLFNPEDFWYYPAPFFDGKVLMAMVIHKPSDVEWPPLIQIQITFTAPPRPVAQAAS